MVRFPPQSTTDAEGWVRALLTDLAGQPEYARELLGAVCDVQSGQASEWSMIYNVFGIEVGSDGARITFLSDSCPVPLETLATVLYKYLWL